ncbi:MAG: hypothetical protein IT275_08525, partial [Chitinophagales bacterium]|nr:hypothetical protein [Chitinophagales bacterium]
LCDSAIVDGKPLVISNELILDVIPEYTEKNYITPSLIFWIVFIIVLLLQMKFSFFSRYKIIPVLYFSILGCLGWLFIFMWFFTEHLSTKWNLNILWAMPLNIPLMLFVFREKLPRLVMSYIKFYRILLIMLLIAWWLNPQTYHNAVVPLILLAILFTSLFLQVPTKEDFKKRLFG